MEVAIAGFKRVREFWQAKAMSSFKIGDEAFPGLRVQTDAQIENIIKKSLNTIYHAACTCSVGHENDTNAVVDKHAKVIGVKGLRVVDAAAFPILPPGHPQATVCEYYSDLLGRHLILIQMHLLKRSRVISRAIVEVFKSEQSELVE